MQSPNDFEKLQLNIRQFCEERDWDRFHTPKDLAIGLSTEAAEVLELFRFRSDSELKELLSDSAFRQKLGFELADVLFFILRFADKYQFDLIKFFEAKMKLNAEKYSVDKSKGSNKKYTEF